MRSYFNWDSFLYALILGLMPSIWDIQTDLQFANMLEVEDKEHAAGLSYAFISLPGLYLGITLAIQLISSVTGRWKREDEDINVGCLLMSDLLTMTMNCGVVSLVMTFQFVFMASYPAFFKYLAAPVASFILIFKTLVLFHHRWAHQQNCILKQIKCKNKIIIFTDME